MVCFRHDPKGRGGAFPAAKDQTHPRGVIPPCYCPLPRGPARWFGWVILVRQAYNNGNRGPFGHQRQDCNVHSINLCAEADIPRRKARFHDPWLACTRGLCSSVSGIRRERMMEELWAERRREVKDRSILLLPRISILVPRVQRRRERWSDGEYGITSRAWTPEWLESGGAGVGHRRRRARGDIGRKHAAATDFDYYFCFPCIFQRWSFGMTSLVL